MAKKQVDENPMMKQYRDLKSKHPDAMLLFRCGDFYETYEDDAAEAAKVLGITLTKSTTTGVRMAGFPHHALDTYLPKLVRTGHRVAICDQLEDPKLTKKLVKRGITELVSPATNNDNNNNNNQNSEDKVMTNENVKVADLIGKSISNGGNAKYTINAIEGDKVSVTFQMGDSDGKSMTMSVAQVEKLLAGGWQVQGGEECRVKSEEFATAQEDSKAEEPKAKIVTMETEPKSKAEQPAKPRKKQPQTKAEEPKQEQPQGKLTYLTYTNKKGKACAKISGFAETDAAYQKEVAASLHGSATYENTKQGRVNFLTFGPRYAEVAKTVCQMLNEGKTVTDCQAVVDAATEERMAKREERMAKREERKQKRETYRQEREGKVQTAKPQGKTYTEAEMLDLMERVMRGDADALAEVNAIKAKAA